jgi:hypothetical protein
LSGCTGPAFLPGKPGGGFLSEEIRRQALGFPEPKQGFLPMGKGGIEQGNQFMPYTVTQIAGIRIALIGSKIQSPPLKIVQYIPAA